MQTLISVKYATYAVAERNLKKIRLSVIVESKLTAAIGEGHV